MSLEIRPFEGTPEQLSEFVISAWDATYRGNVPVPRWSSDYFRWQLRLDEPDSRERLVAAYDGSKLAGVLLFVPMPFRLRDQRLVGSQASWLSVSREFRGQGVAARLQAGAMAAHERLGLKFMLGFGYFGARQSLGVRFWRKSQGAGTTFVRKAGFWARVLDPVRAAAWNLNRWEGRMTQLAAGLLGLPPLRQLPRVTIRPVTAADVPRCAELAHAATRPLDLALDWNADRLARQLGLGDGGRSGGEALVAEVDGQLRGCMGYHLLPIRGRTDEIVGILDLVFVSELRTQVCQELLNSVLHRLREAGAVVALKLRTGDYPGLIFSRWGWFPKPADSYVLVTQSPQMEPLPGISSLRRMHVLWR